MPRFHDDILHEITKRLNPRDLLRFLSTSRNAKEIIGESAIENMKYWLPLWKEYEWADEVLSHGQIPILVFLGKNKSYGHLLIATPKDKTAKVGLSGNSASQKDLIAKIKKSLHSNKTAQHELEIQFNHRFRLDISHTLFASMLHPSREIFHNSRPKQLEVAVYQGKTHVITPVTFEHDECMIIEIPGFVPITLVNQSVGEGLWHRVAHSLGYCTQGKGCDLVESTWTFA
ncbi:hypothetical protein DER44DRAFT_748351 [Fusarium oxysporum]|nr:hypothetical protein DER44DRAFT_748351 [Fusarium oxysporum]